MTDSHQASRDIASIGAYQLGDALAEVLADPVAKVDQEGRELRQLDRRRITACLAAGIAVGIAAMRAAEMFPEMDADWLAIFMGRTVKQEREEDGQQESGDRGDRATDRPGPGEGSGGVPPSSEGADGPATGGGAEES